MSNAKFSKSFIEQVQPLRLQRLADDAITGAKMVNDAVTGAKIEDSSITAANLQLTL